VKAAAASHECRRICGAEPPAQLNVLNDGRLFQAQWPRD
jgi:hypothetical protein